MRAGKGVWRVGLHVVVRAAGGMLYSGLGYRSLGDGVRGELKKKRAWCRYCGSSKGADKRCC